MKQIIVLLVIMTSVGAYASSHGMDHSSHQGMMEAGHNESMMMEHMEHLDGEQQEKFNKINAKHSEDMRSAMLEMEEIDLDIQREMTMENPDQKTIDELVQRKNKLHREHEKDMIRFRVEMKRKFDMDMMGM